ncbi:MAG TPA: hypothetical protein VMJ75_08260, partial [Candidatus Acidoferrales bacterium]|nr:hypothetical protein [Candidatus Acidoferrales bacterium]
MQALLACHAEDAQVDRGILVSGKADEAGLPAFLASWNAPSAPAFGEEPVGVLHADTAIDSRSNHANREVFRRGLADVRSSPSNCRHSFAGLAELPALHVALCG